MIKFCSWGRVGLITFLIYGSASLTLGIPNDHQDYRYGAGIALLGLALAVAIANWPVDEGDQ